MALDPEQQARVDRPGAGRHHQPLQRREAHRRVDRATALHRRQRGAGAEVGGDQAQPPARRPEQLGGAAARVGVGEPVEAVAAQRHVAFGPGRGQGVGAGGGGKVGVEGGVEAGDVRQRRGAPRSRRASPAPPAGCAAAPGRRAVRARPRPPDRPASPARSRAPPWTTRWTIASGSGPASSRRPSSAARRSRSAPEDASRSASTASSGPSSRSLRLEEPALTVRMGPGSATQARPRLQSRTSGMSSRCSRT